jgi:hypothetical protein
MNYCFDYRPTLYNGVLFRSRLEAHWACFFDQVNWKWDYEPMDLSGWTPTFRVEFPCGHSECPESHVILVEVQPHHDIAEFAGHRCMDFPFGECGSPTGEVETIPADASAAFGINPDVTYWEMGHGGGGGVDSVEPWIADDVHALWKLAGNIIRGCEWATHQPIPLPRKTATVATRDAVPTMSPPSHTTRQCPHCGPHNASSFATPSDGSSPKNHRVLGPREQPRD